MILGMDGSEEAQELIRSGDLAATIYVSRKNMAENAADFCIRVAGGENLNGEFIDVCDGKYELMTIDTIDDVLAKG